MCRHAFKSAFLAAIALLIAGCAAPDRRPVPRIHVGAAGASEAAVLYPLDTAAILAHMHPGPEVMRLNSELNLRPPEPLLATNQWPQRARPTITERRRINVEDDEGRYLFFLEQRYPHAWPPFW